MSHPLTIAEAKRLLLLPDLARRLEVPGEIPECDGQSSPCFWPERHNNGDQHPSFNFYAGLTRYNCFGCNASGDGPDLVAELTGLPTNEAIRLFIKMAMEQDALPPQAKPAALPAVSTDSWGDTQEKRDKRATWVRADQPGDSDLAELGRMRGISVDILMAAAADGALAFCQWAAKPAWMLRSSCGRMAQVRRVDNQMWPIKGKPVKAVSLSGSLASVPFGLATIGSARCPVAIGEGGPDWLALQQLLHENGRTDCGVIAMPGGSIRLVTPLLEMLRSRRIRLFPHADAPGRKAAAAWSAQLREVGCEVDAFDFHAFAAKDANELIRLPLNNRHVEVMP